MHFKCKRIRIKTSIKCNNFSSFAHLHTFIFLLYVVALNSVALSDFLKSLPSFPFKNLSVQVLQVHFHLHFDANKTSLFSLQSYSHKGDLAWTPGVGPRMCYDVFSVRPPVPFCAVTFVKYICVQPVWGNIS